MSKTANNILNSAESMIRDGGYYAFSFRQIADELAIKSASVHYHFPTKEALGVAVAARYTEKFIEALGKPTRESPICHYVSLFRSSLENDGRACLCGILAAECGRLPDPLRETLVQFSEQNVSWLQNAFQSEHTNWSKERCQQAALILFSALEGAMVFAALHGTPDHLTSVAESLQALIAE